MQSCDDISFQNENPNSMPIRAGVDCVHSPKPDLNDKNELSVAAFTITISGVKPGLAQCLF